MQSPALGAAQGEKTTPKEKPLLDVELEFGGER